MCVTLFAGCASKTTEAGDTPTEGTTQNDQNTAAEGTAPTGETTPAPAEEGEEASKFAGKTLKLALFEGGYGMDCWNETVEAFKKYYPDVTIEVQQSVSTSGMKAAIEGTCDIGMASRDLKDSELEAGLTPTAIAMDGIAIIVNTRNGLDNITMDQIKGIFTGEITSWGDVQ